LGWITIDGTGGFRQARKVHIRLEGPTGRRAHRGY
jgi:hypothetical protein